MRRHPWRRSGTGARGWARASARARDSGGARRAEGPLEEAGLPAAALLRVRAPAAPRIWRRLRGWREARLALALGGCVHGRTEQPSPFAFRRPARRAPTSVCARSKRQSRRLDHGGAGGARAARVRLFRPRAGLASSEACSSRPRQPSVCQSLNAARRAVSALARQARAAGAAGGGAVAGVAVGLGVVVGTLPRAAGALPPGRAASRRYTAGFADRGLRVKG